MRLFLAFLSTVILSFGISTFAFTAEATPSAEKTQVTSIVNQGLVNINTADAQALTQLKGIGVKKAEAIVAWREANGKFSSIEQLVEVKGIGSATLEANRKIISI
jgi:competence protein ComEA